MLSASGWKSRFYRNGQIYKQRYQTGIRRDK